jgi:NAD(P)-dependent dehydrogenase (short-subunit alcohol dehydrogenase family)
MLCLMEKRKRSLSGQVALVTGAGGGVGRSVALLLASYGVSVVAVGASEQALGEVVGEAVCGGGKARHVVGDVRDPGTLSRAVERAVDVFGGLDIAVASLGSTSVLGASHAFGAALRAMRDGGRLIAMSVVASDAGALGEHAGVVGLVREVALEVGPRRITCNAICAGGSTSATPSGALLEPDEGASVVAFLASSDAAVITGQALTLSGALRGDRPAMC